MIESSNVPTNDMHTRRIVPRWPVPPNVHAMITTRIGGRSAAPYASFNLGVHVGDMPESVAENRLRLRALLPAEPVWLDQVHGTRVINAAEATADRRADAAFARLPGVVCAVQTADCLPVLFADRRGHTVGVAHAGWRGLAAGVLEALVEAMRSSPEDLVAYLGPGIGAAAYQVGVDVFDAFVAHDPEAARAFKPDGTNKFRCDLYGLARWRLQRVGVNAVYGGEYCTVKDADLFFSYRRDGVTGRMASLIWLD